MQQLQALRTSLSTAGVTRRLREFAVRVNKSNHVAEIKQIEAGLTTANANHTNCLSVVPRVVANRSTPWRRREHTATLNVCTQ